MPNRLKRRNSGSGHSYTIDGQYTPGVTTVLGKGLGMDFGIPSNWAARICSEWVVNRRHLLADPTWTNTDLQSMIASAARNTATDAALRGTTVHHYGALLHDTGQVELDDAHTHIAGHVEQYAALLDRWQIEPVASETPLALTELRVAGTADLFATSPAIAQLINVMLDADGHDPIEPDALGVLDIKTGSAIRDKDRLQIVAYGDADLWQPDGTEQPKPAVHWHGLIHVQPDYAELHLIRPDHIERLRALFAACVQQWEALDNKRGWLWHSTINADAQADA